MRALRIGIALAVAAAVATSLVACDDEQSQARNGSSRTSSAARTSTAATSTVADKSDPGHHETIADYVSDLGLKDEKAQPGQDGAPNVSIPTPKDWADAGDETPDYSIGAIVHQGAAAQNSQFKASIVALLSKLPSSLDADEVLEVAGGELANLPNFKAFAPGSRGEMSGFRAYKLAGTYDREGMEAVIAQQTVVIPGPDALYILQLNATSDQAQSDALTAATQEIDRDTVIGFE